MRKSTRRGLGKFIYMEWLIPICDYYGSIRKNEVVFEILVPLITAVSCALTYFSRNKLFVALDGLADLLPTAISILIGFTAMLITLLLTGSGSNIDRLKSTSTDNELRGKAISLYQGLHIQFSHSLFAEILLLILIFMYLFLKGIGISYIIGVIMLIIEIYLTLNILLSILRGITSLYFSFYKQE